MNYYNVIENIKTRLQDTNLVTTTTDGDIFEVDLSKQTLFPLAHIMVNNVNLEDVVVRYNVTILAMDLERDNRHDIHNTQLLMLQRFCEKLKRAYDNDLQLDGVPSLEPFIERFENKLAGWAMTFDLLTGNDLGIC